MKTQLISTLVGLVLMVDLSPVLAVSASSNCDERTDKARYNKLLHDFKAVNTERANILNQAVSEAKKDGQASLETKSHLLALSEKRDRTYNRLVILSLRHGFELPKVAESGSEATETKDEKDRVFEPADQMIKQIFAQEAKQIASNITLPLISIESDTNEVKEENNND
jgi:hypothetical protein